MNRNEIEFTEYGPKVYGCIESRAPFKCPQCVIPTVVVEDSSGLKGLSGCFAHITNIRTTVYIDDKKRMMITWAGPVEADGYDYQNNPLKLRNQVVYDFTNNRGIYYNTTGRYRLFDLTEE